MSPARLTEIVAALHARVCRGPFWVTEDMYVRRCGRHGVALWRAVPHYANPLSPLSPVVLTAGYAHNLRLRRWSYVNNDFTTDLGDLLEFRPFGECAVMFVTHVDDQELTL
jgi:hypothetical protein